MTTKEASELFRISQKDIAKYCKQGLVYQAYKPDGKHWDIPDDTKLILNKKSIISILSEILKLKNNKESPISYKDIDTLEKTILCLDYLYLLGYISEYDKNEKVKKDLLYSAILSDDGISLVFSNNKNSRGNRFCLVNNLNILSLNAGINL